MVLIVLCLLIFFVLSFDSNLSSCLHCELRVVSKIKLKTEGTIRSTTECQQTEQGLDRHGTNVKERGAARMLDSSLRHNTTTQKPAPEPTSPTADQLSCKIDIGRFRVIVCDWPALLCQTGGWTGGEEGRKDVLQE